MSIFSTVNAPRAAVTESIATKMAVRRAIVVRRVMVKLFTVVSSTNDTMAGGAGCNTSRTRTETEYEHDTPIEYITDCPVGNGPHRVDRPPGHEGPADEGPGDEGHGSKD